MKTAVIYILLLSLLGGLPEGTQEKFFQPSEGGRPLTESMVKITGGKFRLFLRANDQPGIVDVQPFFLDVHSVTNADFLAFVKANPEWARSKTPHIFADNNYLSQWAGDTTIGNETIHNSPVTNVSWFAANAYCKWKGKRLPTLTEWEYAASAPPEHMKKGAKLTTIILGWYDHPTPKLLPSVESTYKNDFGLYDMHGLIWEWVSDFNSVITQGADRNTGSGGNSFFCAAGSLNTVNKEDYAAFMRYAFRESLRASYTVGSLGFRCAMDIQDSKTNAQR